MSANTGGLIALVRIVSFNHQGNVFPLFIDDTDTGYTGKDVLSRPGVYEELTTEEFTLPIAELTGSIDGYGTKLMGLIVSQDPGSPRAVQVQDCTQRVKQLLTVPETAAKMLIARESEEMQQFLEAALDVIHFYEMVNSETKVFLPEAAFEYVDTDVAKKMRSTRHVFVLKNVDNQEILQKSCTDVYGVVLPSAEDIHGDASVAPNALDILRVIAPCRKEAAPGVYQYQGIYHTPYYRVDARLRGVVPSYLKHINGYSKNDTLDIQSNERHMYDNLYTLICSDVARYVNEICTGLFITTPIGQKLRRLISCRNPELFGQLTSDIGAEVVDGVTCNVTYTAVQGAIANGVNGDELARLVQNNVSVTTEALSSMVAQCATISRVVDIENLPFVLNLSDDEKEQMTALLLENNIISRAMFEYVIALCCKAYEVNWGHTGAARAIPRFVTQQGIQVMNNVLGAYLSSQLGKASMPADMDINLLYPTTTKASDDEDEEDDDEAFTSFDYYVTDATMQKIIAGQLDSSFFSTSATGAETTDDSIVQYWRRVNGSNNLHYFISSCFIETGDVKVLLECFVKLMRWGEVKPALLVLPGYKNLRTVFDLNVGKEIPNTAIVDESQLVTVNGCKHTLAGLLKAQDVVGDSEAIVGFLLCKDYGVKKYVMASWVDIGEMVDRNELDVAELKSVSTVPLTGEFVRNIADCFNDGYALYRSNSNIEHGLQYGVQPDQLSEIALLGQAGVLRSAEYLKSKQASMVVTTKDRQYQILSNYVSALRSVYQTEGEALSGASISTVELSAIASTVYKRYNAVEQAPDANTVRSNQTIAAMNLGGPQYSDVELVGKFTIISDTELESSLPPIEFSEPAMQKLAQRLRDRVVLLLLETDTQFVLCRKDITQNELLIVDHKIEHKKYSVFAKAIPVLKQGGSLKLSNAKTGGQKKEAVLHRSVAEFI